ncbi:hypothetical protein GGH94_005259 [Coemansia aciculifera]|uniref:ARM repeat-containing protein n=1 Tax=Coemansia aciculifera TaxID=417176 RepID=A0A9W8IE74_9FUNG|nr:hypothetical protein GGH94_005259 [Coemansia aciculifera]
MANTAISPAVMRGVLEQLPVMSGKIVDDTRHEKVLSYMRLFLQSPTCIEQLLGWKLLDIAESCLQLNSDYRVSSVAIRFLGDCLAVHRQGRDAWLAINQGDQCILRWIIENVDSQHALVRFACLYFIRQAAVMADERFDALVEAVDYQRFILRRLLDSSYFVVTEACALLGSMFYRGGSMDPALCELVERLIGRSFEAQSTPHKMAVLATAVILFAIREEPVRVYALEQFSQIRLQMYLFDDDRLIRDKALDILELTLRLSSDSACLARVVESLGSRLSQRTAKRKVYALVALRGLAAIVKDVPANSALCSPEALSQCLGIVHSALAILLHVYGIRHQVPESAGTTKTLAAIETEILDLMDGSQLGASAIANSVACEAARVVREYCRTTFDQRVFAVLEQLLENRAVQRNAQQLQLVLDAIIHSLRLAKQASFSHLLVLPSIVANFAIQAPGLKLLFDLVLESISDQGDVDSAQFVQLLAQSVKARLADVEWEVRDTALEFISAAANTLEWSRAQGLIVDGDLLGDVVSALSDTEEYVRASGAQALVAILGSADAEFRQLVADHSGLGSQQLEQLVNDSEAFVKRAALDLVYALGDHAVSGRLEGREWMHCLTYFKLYQMGDDPDFEVRVRCAKILALLARWMHFASITASDRAFVVELQADALLLDMCTDSSRYVRRVCLDGLLDMKLSYEEASGNVEETGAVEGRSGKRQTVEYGGDGESFYRKLCDIDFARLESTLTAEHLYQEALDTQVEKEMMTETQDPNIGNNILDCY